MSDQHTTGQVDLSILQREAESLKREGESRQSERLILFAAMTLRVAAELHAARERIAEYEETITWQVSSVEEARLLGRCVAETARAERAEAELRAAREQLSEIRVLLDASPYGPTRADLAVLVTKIRLVVLRETDDQAAGGGS